MPDAPVKSNGGPVDPNPNPNPNPLFATQDVVFNTPKPMVDILIVDDNSGSMASKQKSLADRFANFIGSISQVDWQIAVTSTDVCAAVDSSMDCNAIGGRGQFFGPQGQLPKYGNQYILTPSTPNVANVFGTIVQRNSETGSGDERGVYAANLVIDNRFTSTANFFRDGASLAIIIVSDEDERSVGGLIPTDSQYHPLESYDLPQTLIDKVNTTWGGQKSLLVNAIIGVPNDPSCGSSVPGTVYKKLADLTKGIVGCVADSGTGAYTAMINNIGAAIQTHSLNVTLDHIPLTNPIFQFDPPENAVPVKWIPQTNILALESYPSQGTTLHLTYPY